MMDPHDAAWIRENVIDPVFGRQLTQPVYMGQTECLHLADPVCHGCVLGYHGGCSGWSWPLLHETEIANHRGSSLWWDYGSHYLVWTPPRRCECACPQTAARRPTPAAAPALSAPKAESPRVAYEQPDLFAT